MIKKIITLTFFCITFLLFVNMVMAESYDYVYDRADIISVEEDINKLCKDFFNEYKIKIIVETTYSTTELTPKEVDDLAQKSYKEVGLNKEGNGLPAYNLLIFYVALPTDAIRIVRSNYHEFVEEVDAVLGKDEVKIPLRNGNYDEALKNIPTLLIDDVFKYGWRERKHRNVAAAWTPMWGNVRDLGMYKKQVFLVSEENNNIFSAVPIATWYDERDKKTYGYPLLVYNTKESYDKRDYGASSIINFLESYKEKGGLDRVVIFGDIPDELNKILQEKGLYPDKFSFFWSWPPLHNWENAYWGEIYDVVMIDFTKNGDDVKLAASTFASYINAPLVFIDKNMLSKYDGWPNNIITDKNIYIIGDYSSEVEDFFKDLDEKKKPKELFYWSVESVKAKIEQWGNKVPRNPVKEMKQIKKTGPITSADASTMVACYIFDIDYITEATTARPYFEKGFAHELNRDYGKAVKQYEIALEKTPKTGYTVSAALRIANIHFNQNRRKNALDAYRSALSLSYEVGRSEEKYDQDPEGVSYEFWMEKTKVKGIIQYRIAQLVEGDEDKIKEYKKLTERTFFRVPEFGYYLAAKGYENLGDIYESWAKNSEKEGDLDKALDYRKQARDYYTDATKYYEGFIISKLEQDWTNSKSKDAERSIMGIRYLDIFLP